MELTLTNELVITYILFWYFLFYITKWMKDFQGASINFYHFLSAYSTIGTCFGLVVLEAIENNVAVVCSNISPLNEFVANVSNCLVDRDNPKVIASLLEKYFKDNQKELKIIKKLQKEKIVKNFSIDKTAKKIEKFYINTINV